MILGLSYQAETTIHVGNPPPTKKKKKSNLSANIQVTHGVVNNFAVLVTF